MSDNFFLRLVYSTPMVTRVLSGMIIFIMLAVYVKAVSPLSLMYVPAFLKYFEFWRIITCFLYFGKPSLDVVVHITFLYRYSSMLEEGFSYTSDYFYLVLVVWGMLFTIANFITIPVLASVFSSTITYIWTRKNPHAVVQIFGFLSFPAFYLPFVVPLFTIVTERRILADDFLGILVGHIYYFLKDVYPKWGRDVLRTPCFIKKMFGEHSDDCCKKRNTHPKKEKQSEIIDARPKQNINNNEETLQVEDTDKEKDISENEESKNSNSLLDESYNNTDNATIRTYMSEQSFLYQPNSSTVVEDTEINATNASESSVTAELTNVSVASISSKQKKTDEAVDEDSDWENCWSSEVEETLQKSDDH